MSVAWLLRLALAGLLIFALSWLLFWQALGQPLLGIMGALPILFGHGPILALEMSLARWHNQADPAPTPSMAELVLAWWHEAVCGVLVFGWRQPFASKRFADRLPNMPLAENEGCCSRRGVILIHGFMCNRGIWNPWWPHLIEHGTPAVALDLQPALASIDGYAEQIDAAVRQMTRLTGQRPVLVAHSMGGLAVRAWLRAFGANDRVHHVVTVASPHQGTWLARFGRGLNAREMRHRSPWFAPLALAESTLPAARFTCFYSHCDNIVFPCSSATLPHAHNRHLRGRAHVHLLYHPTVIEATLMLLAE
jgi:pimeloyl-ACP methyl ester carboxylesterase